MTLSNNSTAPDTLRFAVRLSDVGEEAALLLGGGVDPNRTPPTERQSTVSRDGTVALAFHCR